MCALIDHVLLDRSNEMKNIENYINMINDNPYDLS